MINKYLLTSLFILTTSLTYCQKSFDTSFQKIDNLRKFNLEVILKNIDTSKVEDRLLFWQYSFLKKFDTSYQTFNSIVDMKKSDPQTLLSEVYYNISLGDYYFYKFFDKDYKAFQFYKNALNISLNAQNKVLICESLKKILNYYENIIHIDDDNFKTYLSYYIKYVYDDIERNILYYYDLVLNFKNKSQDPIFFKIKQAKNILSFFEKEGLTFYFGKTSRQIGIFYDLSEKPQEALTYYDEAFINFDKIKYAFAAERKMICLINKATVLISLKQNNKAEKLLNKAKSKRINKLYTKNYWYLNYWYAQNSYNLKKYKNSFEYLIKSNFIEDSLRQHKHTFQIANLETKYQTEKKEKENLQLKQDNLEIEQKRKQNLYYLIASILVLILTSIIAALTLKNSKRKRKLAEQYKELETQKNITLLKEQEINTINAMVDGQEKERKRIAEDLHDNLGSVLATLKLHFENLKINREKKKINQETLFDKTEGLIDEAYLKVRSIAHAKNAGVIANQGLLLAVQMMAEKISSADKIKIEVIHFGLDKRLDNSLELTVFRIIQELLNNIIKHAEAKNATINIAAYDKNLNIIIEDDGKGFDINKIDLKNGMGISSIKTRIEHLNGTFDVDATIGKGSSIILDIPIS